MNDIPRALDPVTNEPVPQGTNTIPTGQSRTVQWLAATILIMALKKFFKLDLPEADANALLEAGIVFFGNVMGIYYRIKAQRRIEIGPVTQTASKVIDPAGKMLSAPMVAIKNLISKK